MGKEEHRDEKRDDTREPKPTGSSRLGKEAKIGVTVIAVLLVGLGVAVAMRLCRADNDDKQLAVVAERDAKDRPGKPDPLFKDGRSKLFGSSSSPTVVSAKAASIRPSKSMATEGDQWKIPSDRGAAKRAGDSLAMSSPPSFMPDPPKPAREEQRERYALDPPPLKDADDLKPLRHSDRADSDARLAPPIDELPRRSAKSRENRTDAGGFASTTDLPPAAPPYREHSRFENSAPPQPPMHGNSSYSIGSDRATPAMTVGQYGGDEYRPQSSEPRRHNGRRSAASSTLSNPPPHRDDGKYEVQPNDSYWTISERLYGTGAYFKALAQHNRGKESGDDRLQPGALILAPTFTELEKSYPDLCPKPSRREALQSQAQSRLSTVSTRNQLGGGRTYTVAEGDTLFNIARYELGKASRWAEIYDLNREVLGKDFNYLTPGTQLAMPEGEKSDVTAQPPGNTYRR